MAQVKIMMNGIPGNVAVTIAGNVKQDDRFELLPYSLTGPEIDAEQYTLDSTAIQLIRPDQKEEKIKKIIEEEGHFISIDFTHPSAVNDNADFYCSNHLPFVMGTTGGDRVRLEKTVQSSKTAAVIAPNMAKQIVGFQAMMAYAAETFPGLFKDYTLTITESHQSTKADTSGTAKAMVGYFNRMGIAFTNEEIKKIRDHETQINKLGIPEEYIDGHGWHTYSLVSKNGTVSFEFKHNVNGRDVYSEGTMDAVLYLEKKIREGLSGKVFTMIDVLKN